MANITPATFDDPEEIEFFDATYYINGKEVSWNPLPQEIKNAFCKMWDNMTEDSSYHEEDTFDPCDDLPYGDYDEPASTYARE